MENQSQNQERQSDIKVSVDDQELNYWSKEFGIAKEELLAVLKHGGTFSAAIEAYVKKVKFAL